MVKRKRLTGRERREARRRARQGPQLPKLLRGRFLLIGGAAATVAAIAVVLLLVVFAGDGGGGAVPQVLASPTAQLTPTPTLPNIGPPPPVDAEPTFTDSGLGIIDIVPGTGATPEVGQLLVVNYTGWLSDGTVIDTSVGDAQPFQFALGAGSVIAGWDEGFATMKVGAKRRLIIPPDLAYGEEGRPGIPPNSELTFDVELLEIK